MKITVKAAFAFAAIAAVPAVAVIAVSSTAPKHTYDVSLKIEDRGVVVRETVVNAVKGEVTPVLFTHKNGRTYSIDVTVKPDGKGEIRTRLASVIMQGEEQFI